MILLVLAGLASIPSSHAAETNSIVTDHEQYAKVYPTHVEYCAGTELAFVDGVAGGPGGHGFTYIEGLCKDNQPVFKNGRWMVYPRVKPCDGTEGYSGVGVSVNSDFKNVNFVVVPTYALFMNGNLGQGERVTQAVVDRAADDANRLNVFQNVRIKPELTLDPKTGKIDPKTGKPDPKTQTGFAYGSPGYMHMMAVNSIGTDYGTRMGRNLECVRLPFPKARLADVAARLNGINGGYYETGTVYNWDGLKNNCAHLASDLLEAAGVRHAIPKNLAALKQIFYIALPRDGVYTLITNGIMKSMEPWSTYRDLKEDKVNLDNGVTFLPTQVGVLAKKYSIFRDNKVFANFKKAAWLASAKYNIKLDTATFTNPAYSEIGPNFVAWANRYPKVRAIIPNVNMSWWMDKRRAGEALTKQFEYSESDFKAFLVKYDSYLSDRLTETQSRLKEFGPTYGTK
jgi:hypothetical protein